MLKLRIEFFLMRRYMLMLSDQVEKSATERPSLSAGMMGMSSALCERLRGQIAQHFKNNVP